MPARTRGTLSIPQCPIRVTPQCPVPFRVHLSMSCNQPGRGGPAQATLNDKPNRHCFALADSGGGGKRTLCVNVMGHRHVTSTTLTNKTKLIATATSDSGRDLLTTSHLMIEKQQETILCNILQTQHSGLQLSHVTSISLSI